MDEREREEGGRGGDRGKLELSLSDFTLAGLLWLPLLLFPLFLSPFFKPEAETNAVLQPMDHDGRTPLHFDAGTELRAGRDVKDNDGCLTA